MNIHEAQIEIGRLASAIKRAEQLQTASVQVQKQKTEYGKGVADAVDYILNCNTRVLAGQQWVPDRLESEINEIKDI